MLLDTKLPAHYIFRGIWPDVVRVLLISSFFHFLKLALGAYLPPVPLQLPTILGSLISLLLAFKTNQSYERWWEARKIWGAIVNDSRTLVLQARGFIPEQQLAAPLRALAYRQIAWCYCLGESLRGLDSNATLASYLPESEIVYAQSQANRPLAILALHTAQLKALYEQGALNSFQQVQLDATLVRLCDALGQAERLKSTVFPASYRRLVHFFIYLFLLTLSLGLVQTIGLWEIPVLLTTASTFFLLERTARELQDPFRHAPTDTPVTALARTIEINLRQLLGEVDVPAPVAATGFYLL
jgi:putative membrane protein